MISLSVIALLQVAPSQPLFEIPLEFRGEYNANLNDCGTGNNDSKLRISWDRLRFWESSGKLKELLRLPDGSVVISAEMSGEGEKWMSVYQLRLSEEGKKLSVIHPQTADLDQIAFDRFRCPSRASQ